MSLRESNRYSSPVCVPRSLASERRERGWEEQPSDSRHEPGFGLPCAGDCRRGREVQTASLAPARSSRAVSFPATVPGHFLLLRLPAAPLAVGADGFSLQQSYPPSSKMAYLEIGSARAAARCPRASAHRGSREIGGFQRPEIAPISSSVEGALVGGKWCGPAPEREWETKVGMQASWRKTSAHKKARTKDTD